MVADMNVKTEVSKGYSAVLVEPEVAALCVIHAVHSKVTADKIDCKEMLALLRRQSAEVQGGDLSKAEAMLMSQATALQALFVKLVERGMKQDQMPNLEGFMRLALRSQSQCRATLETLATIKNPPVVYAAQANVTTGPQQINNGATTSSQARGIENEQSKLLVDRATDDAVSSYSTLETLGEKHRAKVRRR